MKRSPLPRPLPLPLRRPTLPRRRPTAAAAARKRPTAPTKAISVMAWVEDAYGNVLLVKQSRGKKLWSFPGGKVRAKESLIRALHREVREELGLLIDVATPIDIYDRAPKAAISILFRVILRPGQTWKPRKGEIDKFAFRHKPPLDGTPSLRFFWKRAQATFEPLASLKKI